MTKFKMYGFLLGPILALLAGCNGGQSAESDSSPGVSDNAARKGQSQEVLAVYKSPTCGCCGEWVTHIENEGFATTEHDTADMAAIKQQHGIGAGYQSCHTAVSNTGYVFEGHVPAKYIHQFLADTPEGAIGLAVPGMPVGSPGMEMEDRFESYDVMLLKKDGSSEIYATVTSLEQQHTK